MILWTANLGRGVSVSEFIFNLDRVLKAGGPRAVFCLQEVDEADKPEEHDIIRARTKGTHRLIGGRTAVPILVPRHLDVVDWNLNPACKGLALISPHRQVNEVTLQLPRKIEVGVLNTHLPRHVPPLTNSRRAECRQCLRREARGHGNGAWVADTNTRKGWPTMVPGERAFVDAGIDKGKAWADAAHVLRISDRRTVDLTIDGHDAHGARLWWAKAA